MTDMLSRSLVLAAAPGGRVDDPALDRARAALSRFHIFEDRWLAPSRVRQMLFAAPDDLPLAPLRAALTEAVGRPDLDIALVADDLATSRKKLLVADMESTIIEQEMLDELADFVGARQRIAEITERAMRGELDFEAALRERVAMLSGLDAAVLDAVAERMTYMPGSAQLVATMKAGGATCALVSGGFTVFTARVARHLGFDTHQANELEIENGRLTGRVKDPILGRTAKKEAIERLATSLGLDLVETMAVGDGANDLDMLGTAGLGVAFRAKPKVRAAVSLLEGGAVISNSDLTALLYLQGYRDTELVG